MDNERIVIKKIKQDICWHILFDMFTSIYEYWGDYDEGLRTKLADLLQYAVKKIDLPKNSKDIIRTYAVVEYEEIQNN